MRYSIMFMIVILIFNCSSIDRTNPIDQDSGNYKVGNELDLDSNNRADYFDKFSDDDSDGVLNINDLDSKYFDSTYESSSSFSESTISSESSESSISISSSPSSSSSSLSSSVSSISSSSSITSSSSSEAEISKYLLKSYCFDNGLVEDISGEALINNNVVEASGKYGKAYQFNGTDSYIDCGNDSVLQKFPENEFTISVWIKPDKAVDMKNQDLRTIIGQAGSPTFTSGYALGYGSMNNKAIIYFACISGFDVTSETEVVVGQWHHIVVSFSSGDKEIYLDGKKLISVENYFGNSGFSISNNDITIGSSENGLLFSGIIDGLKIYSKALSQTEIETIQ